MLSLHLSGVEVRFPGLDSPALEIPDLTLPAGGALVVAGPSGSGKSTLVNIVTGLERPTKGHVLWNGSDLANLSEAGRDRWRGANIGLIMQDFHLFPGLSALENVLLPARLARVADAGLVARAAELLDQVGLKRPTQKTGTMSRGEMQRVVVARALLRRPGVIVADEPTASLDPANGAAIGALLTSLAHESGATLIIVSHDPALIALLPRRLVLAGGRVASDGMHEEKVETV